MSLEIKGQGRWGTSLVMMEACKSCVDWRTLLKILSLVLTSLPTKMDSSWREYLLVSPAVKRFGK